jgi:hypothetical protein
MLEHKSMPKVNIDVNCLINVEQNRPDAPFTRELCDARLKGKGRHPIDPQVP